MQFKFTVENAIKVDVEITAKKCSKLLNYYAKCGWDTRTCPHEFHVDVENEISRNGNISKLLFFSSFAKPPVLKTI